MPDKHRFGPFGAEVSGKVVRMRITRGYAKGPAALASGAPDLVAETHVAARFDQAQLLTEARKPMRESVATTQLHDWRASSGSTIPLLPDETRTPPKDRLRIFIRPSKANCSGRTCCYAEHLNAAGLFVPQRLT